MSHEKDKLGLKSHSNLISFHCCGVQSCMGMKIPRYKAAC